MSVGALARKRNAKEESFSRQSVLSGTEVHHVDVSAKPDVISQIPARIIRISVDHDVVGIPQPVGAVVEVIGRDAPEKSVELEPRRATANEAIDVTATDVTGEMTVLPRMSEVIVRARAAADPLAGGGMNVRRGGMARPVVKSRMLVALRRMSGSRGLADMRGTAGRDVAVADLLGGARCRVRGGMRSLWVLCGKRAEQTQEQSCCDSDEFFHDTPPGLALHTTPLRGMESRSFVERAHWPKGRRFSRSESADWVHSCKFAHPPGRATKMGLLPFRRSGDDRHLQAATAVGSLVSHAGAKCRADAFCQAALSV